MFPVSKKSCIENYSEEILAGTYMFRGHSFLHLTSNYYAPAGPGTALAPKERVADQMPSLLAFIPTDQGRHEPAIFKVNSCKAQLGGFLSPRTSVGAIPSSQKVPEGATPGSS